MEDDKIPLQIFLFVFRERNETPANQSFLILDST